MTSIRIDNRSAYEFLLTLVAYATPGRADSYDVGPEWFARMDRAAGPELKERIARLAGGCEHVFIRLLDVAADLSPPGTAEALIEAVSALVPAEARLTLLGYYERRTRRRAAGPLILDAAGGSWARGRELIEAVSDGPECERAFGGLLARTDEEVAAMVVSVLRDWYESVFRDQYAEVRPVLDREAGRLQGRANELPDETFLAEATNGAEVVPNPGVEEITLFPTWILRPRNIVVEHGSSVLVGLPVPPEHLSPDPEAPPERLVRLASALGDERRLRILRRLTTGSYGLQELAEHFAIPKTTLLHHLVVLRGAGIVRVGGPGGKYTIRAGSPVELQRLLEAYLPAARATRPAANGPAENGAAGNGAAGNGVTSMLGARD